MSDILIRKYIRQLILENLKKIRSYTLEDYQSDSFKSDIVSYIDSGKSEIYENIFIAWQNKVKDYFSQAESDLFISNLRNCLDILIKTTLQNHSMKSIMDVFFKNLSPMHFRANYESRFMEYVFGENWKYPMSEYRWDAIMNGKTFKENFINCDTISWLKDTKRTKQNPTNLHNLSGFILKFIIFEIVENKVEQLSRQNLLLSLDIQDVETIKKVKNIKNQFMKDFEPHKGMWDFFHFVGAFISNDGLGPLESLKKMFNNYTTAKSRDEIAAIAIPKKQSSLDGWDILHKKSAVGFKLSGVVTSMYGKDIYSTVFSDTDTPLVGGYRKSSGFNRQPWESAAHASPSHLNSMLSVANKNILKPHNFHSLEKQKDGFKYWNNYIESFVDNWKITGIVINPEIFAQQFADSMWSLSPQEIEEEIDDCITFFIELQDSGFEIYYAPNIKDIVSVSKLSLLGELIEKKL